MEVDKSLQSRQTYNKKLINNNLESKDFEFNAEANESPGEEEFSIEVNSLPTDKQDFQERHRTKGLP